MLYRTGSFVILTLLICVQVFLCGCRSGRYYQAEAAAAAREYLLANAPELSPDQIYFVKYNDPVLLISPVLGTDGGGFAAGEEKMSSMQRQICVTWNIPGAKHLYMVFGVSDNRMFSWTPIRLIRKDFSQQQLPEDGAIAVCRQFAVNSLYHSLSVVDLNRIRFTFPVIARTAFELNFNGDGKRSAEEIAAAAKAAADSFQYSLVWYNEDGSAIVFCGTGNIDLSGWNINFAGKVSKKDLEKHTLGIVRTPDQQNQRLVPLAKDQAAAAAGKKGK